MIRNAIIAVAALAILPTAAQAASYNVADFSTGNSGTFTYGTGTGGTGFSAFDASTFDPACYDTASPCYGDQANYTTVRSIAGGLELHPSPGAADTVVHFNQAGTFNISGSFSRLNPNDNMGNGVLVSIFNGATEIFSGALPTTFGAASNFNLANVTIASGSALSFVVNNNGQYEYDSTALVASISSVPEPATWAMMLLGFGAVGTSLRRRQKGDTKVRFA